MTRLPIVLLSVEGLEPQTTSMGSRLEQNNPLQGFQLFTPVVIPSRVQMHSWFERPDRFLKQKDIRRD